MQRLLLTSLVIAVGWCLTAVAVDFSRYSYEFAPNQTIIASGFQRFGRLNNADGPKTRFNPTAGAVGYVYSQGVWEVGGAFSYESGTRKLDAGAMRYQVESDMPGVSLFGGINTPDGWYMDASTFLGFGTYKAKNGWSAADGVLGGGNRLHKTVYAVGVEGGRDFDLGGSFFLTPHVGLDYAYTPGETYHWRTTTDGLASQSYWEIPLGVTVSKVLDYGSWQVIPKVDVTMVNAIGNMDVMNAQPGYAYRTAKGWQVAGIGGDHVGARLSAGVDARIGGRTTVEFDYTYEGRKNYNEHRLSAMLGWSF